jgi:uncharacterized protein (DUF433 family)
LPLDGAIIGEGIYAPREAARLIGATSADVIRWTRGSGASGPIWKGHYQFLADSPEISFLDLVELRVVQALRNAGISLQAIRFAIGYVKKAYSIDRPLSSRQFKTDGSEILMDAIEEDGEYVSLSKGKAGQKIFSRIVAQSVSGLEYDGDHVRLWRPDSATHVVIDPQRAFGTPLLEDYGVSTEVLFRDWQRTKDYGYLGRLYEIEESHIRNAVRYEAGLTETQKARGGQRPV